MDKPSLRREMLARRLALTEEERRAAAQNLMRHAVLPTPGVVAGYVAVRHEIDVMPLLNALSARGVVCALPVVCHGKVMTFCRWRPGMLMQKNRYGIEEPEAAEEVVPDTVLVPLLAYDLQGHRLGYGGGYYDATLSALPQVQAIGCAYHWQLLAGNIPADPHDRKLKAVLTDHGFTAF